MPASTTKAKCAGLSGLPVRAHAGAGSLHRPLRTRRFIVLVGGRCADPQQRDDASQAQRQHRPPHRASSDTARGQRQRLRSTSSRGHSSAPSGGIEAATAGLPDLCDTNAPLSSTLAFLAEEVCSRNTWAPFPHQPVVRNRRAPARAAASVQAGRDSGAVGPAGRGHQRAGGVSRTTSRYLMTRDRAGNAARHHGHGLNLAPPA